MFGFNLPGMNGIKTKVGAWSQMIAAFLLALVGLINLVNDCIQGTTALNACIDQIPTLFIAVIVAGNGLMGLGIGHKLEKQNSGDVQ